MAVSQPMDVEDAGKFEIHTAPYAVSTDVTIPGLPICSTCSPDTIHERGREEVRSREGNQAYLWGLSVRVEGVPFSDWNRVSVPRAGGAPGAARESSSVETLRVWLDVSGGVEEAERRSRESIERYLPWLRRTDAWRGLDDSTRVRREEEVRRRTREDYSRQLASLVEATVACIRENAARSPLPLGFLDLTIEGGDGLGGERRVYPVEALPPAASFWY